ncbi:hypothetical protein STCU_05921 [Strigomonas culicis]|uniref:Uncharacterized protein n=1 Tax=Strigomonas culicis TaxID=28005 RepID=S9VV42_9TRYP|nr:hypothetical protein STCU_07044 [Strigomonas culicis]EPY27100.1 hypothetical protein STCU_05921 [Strigomonas culicis]|eukprot:EPY24709.1 hypothetical protein STCU_07044 [Strigomonas culicis]
MPSPTTKTPARASGPLRHLPYYAPFNVYFPTVLIFALLHYATFATTPDPAHPRKLLPPAYLRRLEAAYGDGSGNALGSVLYLLADFFERTVVQHYYILGDVIFGAQNVVWVVVGAWFIHLFELGMCVRICAACRARPWHTLLYMFCTATGGFAQLAPLMKARDAYVRSQQATESTAEETEAKKKK